jgi:hypothetical protein
MVADGLTGKASSAISRNYPASAGGSLQPQPNTASRRTAVFVGDGVRSQRRRRRKKVAVKQSVGLTVPAATTHPTRLSLPTTASLASA